MASDLQPPNVKVGRLVDTLHLSYQAPFCDHRAPNYGKSSIYQNKPAKFTQLLYAVNLNFKKLQTRPALQVERMSTFLTSSSEVTSDLNLYGGFLSKSANRFLYTVELTLFSRADDAFAITKAKCFGYFSNFPEMLIV